MQMLKWVVLVLSHLFMGWLGLQYCLVDHAGQKLQQQKQPIHDLGESLAVLPQAEHADKDKSQAKEQSEYYGESEPQPKNSLKPPTTKETESRKEKVRFTFGHRRQPDPYGWTPKWVAEEVQQEIESTWDENLKLALQKKMKEVLSSPFHSIVKFPESVSPNSTEYYFMHAGDLSDMWFRDSCATLHPYLLPIWPDASQPPPVRQSPILLEIVQGVARTLFTYFELDHNCPIWQPHSPLKESKCPGRKWKGKKTNFELDQPLYLIRMLWYLFKAVPEAPVLRENITIQFAKKALDIFIEKQGPHGLIATSDRPSDDPVHFPFNIPGNFFALSTLHLFEELVEEVWSQVDGTSAKLLESNVKRLIKGLSKTLLHHERHSGAKKGTVPITYQTSSHASAYCFEVDSKGACLHLEDANLPSLISIAYLDGGVGFYNNSLFRKTAARVLTHEGNPQYFRGKYAEGVGSSGARTGRMIWVMGLLSRALTAENSKTMVALLKTILKTHPRFGLHESFDPNRITKFTRRWFDWPHALFMELVLRCCSHMLGITGQDAIKHIPVEPEWIPCAFKNQLCELNHHEVKGDSVCIRYGTGWPGKGFPLWTIKKKKIADFPVTCNKKHLKNPAPSLPKTCYISYDITRCT
eukprot:m.219641 g.219641  ORF g.219641 m.219641 type:complete len:638 (+) comp15916_c0_seq5:238-2151(+)